MRIMWLAVLTTAGLVLAAALVSEHSAAIAPADAGEPPKSACKGLAATTSLAAAVFPGKTNALYIDDDGDGFGVGSPKGPDADDADPEVNTPQSVLKKYGTMAKFLEHRGIVASCIFYIAVTGDDSRGRANQPERPYRTFAKVLPNLQPGDVVLFSAGRYKGDVAAVDIDGLHGKAGKPITILASPGEAVVLEGGEHCVQIQASSHLVLEGFTIDRSDPAGGDGIRMVQPSHVTLREMEVKNQFWGVKGMQGVIDLRIERMVIHDNPGEHGIYLGCRELVNRDILVRRCLIYRNAQQGFQHNGRVKNLTVELCALHTNGQAGVQLMMGVCDSAVRRNLIFNNAKQGVSFYNYISSQSDILPYDVKNNVVEENIVWVGRSDWHEQYDTSKFPAVQFNDSTGAKGQTMSGNTVRNNVLASCDGPVLEFRQERFAARTKVEGNLLYRAGGKDKLVALGEEKSCDLEGLAGLGDGWKENVFDKPPFKRASEELYLKPEKFDFSRP